ncbi:MAG TPA: ATP synthase F1 subunit gamma [Phycisphaerales bacterium]|nr:ATP synthase F1 subunit gamma [Phycisphaerales bacterium]
MGKTREIKKRIKAVGNIRRITKTMQMIATSKFARAQQASTASKPYTEALFQLVTELAAGLGDMGHPLLDSGRARSGKPLTLVLTSDRGLCGPYNGAVLRSLMGLLRNTPGVRDGIIELVGRKGAGFLKFANVPVAQQHNQFGDKPSYDAVRALADEYINKFKSGEVSTVRVVYMKYISAGRQTPTAMQILPFQTPEAKPGADKAQGPNQVFEFSPSAGELLDDLLPAAVKALLFQAFNDAVVSEHVARMVAMKAATDNAGKMGKALTRKFNRARQAQITTELTEIISGAAALE